MIHGYSSSEIRKERGDFAVLAENRIQIFIYHKFEPTNQTKSMKYKRMKKMEAAECLRIKAALPAGGITRIAHLTGYDQQIVQRTLKGVISIWDKRHNLIIKQAKSLIDSVAIK